MQFIKKLTIFLFFFIFYFQNVNAERIVYINMEKIMKDSKAGKEIIDRLICSDLFETRKLFILKDPQQIKGKVVKELISYCQNPLKNHFLVLINDNYMDKSFFSKNLPKYISKINVSTPFQNELLKWAKFFINDNKKNISDELLSQIIETCGDSLYNIKNEIDKICLLSEDDTVTKSI